MNIPFGWLAILAYSDSGWDAHQPLSCFWNIDWINGFFNNCRQKGIDGDSGCFSHNLSKFFGLSQAC